MPNHHRLRLIALISSLSTIGIVQATQIPNTDDPVTFLGPTARMSLTTNIGSDSAFSVAGDAGIRNFRVGGTLGWNIGDNQRFKVTGEYLWQQITYGFFSGDAKYWAEQGDVGVEYQYDLANTAYQPQVGFNAYVAYSPSKNFGLDIGSFVDSNGVTQNFVDNRRATGSRAFGVGPVATVTPWKGGLLKGAVTYENVGYDNDFPVNQNARGFGVTARYDQALSNTVGLGFIAAITQPFNNYTAKMSWSDLPYFSHCIVSVFGEYTVGKHTLPDTYNAGLSADFILDYRKAISTESKPNEELSNLKPVQDKLMAWTSQPAIYMPVVLSVADQQVQLSF